MIIALAIVATAITAFATFLLVVILGTRQEPDRIELRSQAPNHFAGAARRMLGVYVGRPDEASHEANTEHRPTIACHAAANPEEGDPR